MIIFLPLSPRSPDPEEKDLKTGLKSMVMIT
jgi:hypothetical protein